VFTFYDHPILGRPRGSIVVARLRGPMRFKGALYQVFGQRIACRPQGRPAQARGRLR
jgi:hypothetical protein